MPNKQEREYRNMVIRALDSQEEDAKIVTGYASTFGERYTLFAGDGWRYDEIVEAEAFDDTDMSDVIMQYNHEGRVFARISNGTLEVDPDKHGLHTRANLGGTEIGRQLFEEIEGGYTTKMSFGFRVAADKREQTEEMNEETGVRTITVLRTITEISKLYDVSAVSLPANDATSISARNYGEGVIAEIRQELLAREERERRKKLIKLLCEV